jgi:hypothetical protein
VKGIHLMHTNRTKLALSISSLAASGLLIVASPTGTSEATWRKPPMPCIAIRVGLFPTGSGFCPGTTGGLDWNKIERRLHAAGRGTTKPVNATPMTLSQT